MMRGVLKRGSFGHLTAAFPLAVALFMPLWYGLGVHPYMDAKPVGPWWYVRLGGDDFVRWPIRLCLVAGLACAAAGLKSRRAVTVAEGLWCFAAFFPLMFWFMLSQF